MIAGVDPKRPRKPGSGLARPRRTHRHIERQHQNAAARPRRPPHQVEPDRVIVAGKAIELKPEYIGGDRSDLFDGGTADRAEHVRDAGALCRARQMQISARPHDRRAAHRRHPNRRGEAAAEQFDIAGRQRRHDAIARHQLHRIECSPIAFNPGILKTGATIGVFEAEMRHPALGTPAQILNVRVGAMQPRIAGIGTMAGGGQRRV